MCSELMFRHLKLLDLRDITLWFVEYLLDPRSEIPTPGGVSRNYSTSRRISPRLGLISSHVRIANYLLTPLSIFPLHITTTAEAHAQTDEHRYSV